MIANAPVEQPTEPPRRAAWLVLVVAFVLIAIVATVVLVFTYIPPPPHAVLVYRATATAQTRQLTQTYAPAGIGPCDKVDPPYSAESASYWQWGSNPGDVTCPGNGVTRLATSDAYVAFYGFPAGWPYSFMATATVSFNSSAKGPACLAYGLNGATFGLTLCDNGQWTSVEPVQGFSGNGSGSITKADRYVIGIQTTPKAAILTINNVIVAPFNGHGAITDITLDTFSGLPPEASIDIERFAITPQTGN
jgi:hypothetical protein